MEASVGNIGNTNPDPVLSEVKMSNSVRVLMTKHFFSEDIDYIQDRVVDNVKLIRPQSFPLKELSRRSTEIYKFYSVI